MTLQTAKNNVLKAIKIHQFAIRKNLPSSNYKAIAYRKSIEKLSYEDAINFQEWYNNLN